MLVPIGVVVPGDRVQWRVFATDGTGQILPGSTASDASTLAISGARVATVAPAGGGVVAAGTNTTFAWTSFPGAAGYLFEYTLNPSGLAEANRTTPESTQSAFPVMAGAFTQSSNAVQLTIPVPLGVAPAGTSVQWRVFPVDVTRQVLPGAVASDANSFKLQ